MGDFVPRGPLPQGLGIPSGTPSPSSPWVGSNWRCPSPSSCSRLPSHPCIPASCDWTASHPERRSSIFLRGRPCLPRMCSPSTSSPPCTPGSRACRVCPIPCMSSIPPDCLASAGARLPWSSSSMRPPPRTWQVKEIAALVLLPYPLSAATPTFLSPFPSPRKNGANLEEGRTSLTSLSISPWTLFQGSDKGIEESWAPPPPRGHFPPHALA